MEQESYTGGDEGEEHPAEGGESEDLTQQCVEDCNECHLVCAETVTYCLQTGGRHAELPHVRLLLDCADLCHLTATAMLRRSEFSARLCTLCAEMCDRCAESCEQFSEDQWMIECAEACRTCAESCREMARTESS